MLSNNLLKIVDFFQSNIIIKPCSNNYEIRPENKKKKSKDDLCMRHVSGIIDGNNKSNVSQNLSTKIYEQIFNFTFLFK